MEIPPCYKNILVDTQDIELIINRFHREGDVKLRVKDIEYYRLAFTNKSYFLYPDLDFYKPTDSNERLEFLGDSILGAIITDYLYNRFKDKQEGFLTEARTKLVRSATLAKFARKVGLHRFILLGIPTLDQIQAVEAKSTPFFTPHSCCSSICPRTKVKQLEDVFEALLGAIALDQGNGEVNEMGWKAARQFIISCIEGSMDVLTVISQNDNYKDVLQRFFQYHKFPTPLIYLEFSPSNESSRLFGKVLCIQNDVLINWNRPNILRRCVQQDKYLRNQLPKDMEIPNGLLLICSGIGSRKTIAEQFACKNAMSIMCIPPDF
jgi:ribonuclease-3